jgi:hypothetical protein
MRFHAYVYRAQTKQEIETSQEAAKKKAEATGVPVKSSPFAEISLLVCSPNGHKDKTYLYLRVPVDKYMQSADSLGMLQDGAHLEAVLDGVESNTEPTKWTTAKVKYSAVQLHCFPVNCCSKFAVLRLVKAHDCNVTSTVCDIFLYVCIRSTRPCGVHRAC